jgi:TolB-like protein
MPIVAVLPLTYRAGDEELEVLAEDLTEEISRELARSRLITVIAAGMMAAWRGRTIDHKTLGRELGARYLTESKLQHIGENIRLTIQLIDTESASTAWSTRYLRNGGDIASLVEELPGVVGYELGEQILQTEMKRAMGQHAPCSAWDHAMRAMTYARRPGIDGLRRAQEEARLAIAAQPDLGLAHALCVWALAVPVPSQGMELDAQLDREIRMHIERAMQLDGDNPEVLNWILSGYAALGDRETNRRLAQRLAQLQPGTPNSYFWLGTSNAAVGRTSEAIAALENFDRVATVDNRRATCFAVLGMCYLLENRLDEAEAAFDRALALHPEFHMTLRWKTVTLAHNGKEAAALVNMRRLKQAEQTLTVDNHVRAMAFTPELANLSADAIATFRRLWVETEEDK